MKTCPFYCPYMEIYACICVFVALSQWPPLPAACCLCLLLLFFRLVMVFLLSLCAPKNGSFYWLSCCSYSWGNWEKDWQSLCGLSSKCHIDLLTCVNYCLVWLSAAPPSTPLQMINVSKFLEIAPFEKWCLNLFLFIREGVREGERETQLCAPKKVLAFMV